MRVHGVSDPRRRVTDMEGELARVRGLENVWASRRPRSRWGRPHVVTADGPLRVFTLLHDARAVLLDLGKPGSVDIGPRA